MKLRFAIAAALAPALWAEVNVPELVRKSVAASQRNWEEAPHYSWVEHDVEGKLDSHGRVKSEKDKTFRLVVIDGSEFKIPHSAGETAVAEEQSIEAERQRRQRESASERSKRVAKYQKERLQDRAMMKEMAEAFTFKLDGEKIVDGHDCWVLDAEPKPGYIPKTRDTKVLTGMRGRMWVDKQSAQWVRVEAEVIHPVSFYAVASVGPGTKFELEQEPVGDGVWLPKHFAVKVNATVLMFSRNTSEDDTYSQYRKSSGHETLSKR